MVKKLCIVTGVGPETGTGAEIARFFSENGYHVAMISRTEENLKYLEKKYQNTTAYPCDVGDLKKLEETINNILMGLNKKVDSFSFYDKNIIDEQIVLKNPKLIEKKIS